MNKVRDTTVCMRSTEKEKLDLAAEEIYGTTEVPYSTTIMHLIERATEIEAVN